MHKSVIALATAASLALLGGCNCEGPGNTGSATSNQSAGKTGANSKTIAAGLPAAGKFMTAAKAAGLDETLSGSESYTVLVPDDAAFDKLPAGTLDQPGRPEARAAITRSLTYHILPGEIRAADIQKAIENSKGKAILMTMSGATLTASKEGNKIVLADTSGGKATIGKADDLFANGVVHHIDVLLSPGEDRPNRG
jgi:uncharacterized surface protein with fasciclin (FAS1) repeats